MDQRLLEPHRRDLWAIGYRMCGVAADADEVVQEAFLRAVERPPDLSRPLGPWLRAVVLNLSRDRLRRRRRAGYIGPWLPQPVDVDDWVDTLPGPEARVSARESVSYGFLVALEALTPQQRAVLLVRDVLDYDGDEAAALLGLSPANVRVVLHRARRRLADWQARRQPLDAAHDERARAALTRLLTCLSTGDVEGARAAFTEDAVARSDGGGIVSAARVPLVGPPRIVQVYAKLAAHATLLSASFVRRNGLWAFAGALAPRAGDPDGFVQLVELAPDGRIARFYSVLTPTKR
jgi:RNA polymerase sigma factor (sigma-70 family)